MEDGGVRGSQGKRTTVTAESQGVRQLCRSVLLQQVSQGDTMMSWKVVVVSFYYYQLCTWAASHRSRALFPSASRVKRGLAEMVNPIFHNSVEDVNLLFEILLAWLPVLEESGSFCVPDEELASMRQTQKLGLICEDVLPQRLTDIRRLSAQLSQRQAPLRREDFERTVLTMVYTARRMANTTGHQREAWADSFVSLYRAVKQDLTPGTP